MVVIIGQYQEIIWIVSDPKTGITYTFEDITAARDKVVELHQAYPHNVYSLHEITL